METEKKRIVCLSGGKDSVYMLLWLLENGYPVDEIVYCEVFATPFLSGDFPEMDAYLAKVESYTGRKITRIRSQYTFEDVFYRVKESGGHAGEIYGFPYTIGAWCNSRLKVDILDRYFAGVGPHVRYIGIAADEPARYERLAKNCEAPLYENGITEAFCRKELERRGLLNPLYDKFKRLGCWFCPKQGLDALRILYRDYPEYWQLLLQWDNDSPVPFKPGGITVAQLDSRFREELAAS